MRMRTLLAAILLVPALALAQDVEPLRSAPDHRRAPGPDTGASADLATTARAAAGRPRLAVPRPRGGARPRPPARAARPAQPTDAAASTAPPAAALAARGAAGGPSARRRASCVPLQGRFMLTFNKADIVDVLEQASRWTCRNFIYTDDVARGKITLLSKTPVTSEEAYAAFLSALSANNITIFATGKYYKLGRSPDSKKLPIPTYTDPQSGVPATEQMVTKVIRLQSTDADMLRGRARQLHLAAGRGHPVHPARHAHHHRQRPQHPPHREDARDHRPARRRRPHPRRPAPLRRGQGRGRQAQPDLPGPGRRPRAAGLHRRPIPQRPGDSRRAQPPSPQQARARRDHPSARCCPTSAPTSSIVIADDKSFQRLQDLLEQLDVPTGADGGIHVVFLKNASAEDLATTLSSLAQGKANRARRSAAPVPAALNAGHAPGRRRAVARRVRGRRHRRALQRRGEDHRRQDRRTRCSSRPAGPTSRPSSRLIEKLDRPRRQVFVEAVVMEVNLDNEIDLGVGAHGFVDVTVNGKKGVLPLISQPRARVSSLNAASIVSLGGFLTGFTGPTSGDAQGPDRRRSRCPRWASSSARCSRART